MLKNQEEKPRLMIILIKIRNVMIELSSLALEYGVEHSLYHSSNLAKIYGLLGKKRHVKITKDLLDFDADENMFWILWIKRSG